MKAAIQSISLLADNDLIDLSAASASYPQDEEMIRALLKGREEITCAALADLIRNEVKSAAETKAQGLDRKFVWAAAGVAALAAIGAAAAEEGGDSLLSQIDL